MTFLALTLEMMFLFFMLLSLLSLINFLLWDFIKLIGINLIYSWYFTMYLLCMMLFSLVMGLLTGLISYVFILGVNLVYLFMIAYGFWFCSIFGGNYLMARFYVNFLVFSMGLFLFDMFVSLLRPVTLTLRILINVTLGHTLIMLLNVNLFMFLFLVWAFELFVYLIQSYVFTTLCNSYLELLN